MISTQTKTQELLERHQRYLFPAQSNMLYYGQEPLAVERAKDQYLWDVEGNRYLDFFNGILTVSVGHCNEEITRATAEQLTKVQHTSTLYMNEITVKLAEKLADITPGALRHSFFTNSGTEADELAVLAARMHTGNTDVIAMRHAYSGRSLSMMSMTAHAPWRLGNVFDGAIKHVRNPYYYRAPVAMSEQDFVELCVRDLEELIATCTNGRIAAFVAEPIQGVGGFIVPPQEYFRRIEPIVRAAGGLLIIDEVQTGWGRTGKYWCGIEHWGVSPDIMTFAKGMANGYPIGCTIATPEVAEAVKGLTLSTFGGNPVAMATAYATVKYVETHRLWDNAEVQGARLRAALEQLQEQHAFIGDVRGMGLMQALEIAQPGGKQPDAQRTTALLTAARKRGLLIGKGGLYGNVIRIAPQLNVSAHDIDSGCEMLAAAAADVA